MAKPFAGKIALDVRDSVPDWEPFLAPKAPKGSPNVLMVAWDDVGYGAMDVFGGPIKTPTMQRIADRGGLHVQCVLDELDGVHGPGADPLDAGDVLAD